LRSQEPSSRTPFVQRQGKPKRSRA
jgi:hypothetical protein